MIVWRGLVSCCSLLAVTVLVVAWKTFCFLPPCRIWAAVSALGLLDIIVDNDQKLSRALMGGPHDSLIVSGYLNNVVM